MQKKYLLILFIFSISCSSKNKIQSDSTSLKQNCYQDREVNSRIEREIGKIEFMLDAFFISTENSRYQPCEMPDSFQKEGLVIIFSGETRKPLPNERRAGTPIHLEQIELQK
jgi:hypothetical protein